MTGGIMYAMYNNGLKDKHWKALNNLNTDRKAKIKTKYGPTRIISITDSIIRQMRSTVSSLIWHINGPNLSKKEKLQLKNWELQ